jgi:hypothetical protein
MLKPKTFAVDYGVVDFDLGASLLIRSELNHHLFVHILVFPKLKIHWEIKMYAIN